MQHKSPPPFLFPYRYLLSVPELSHHHRRLQLHSGQTPVGQNTFSHNSFRFVPLPPVPHNKYGSCLRHAGHPPTTWYRSSARNPAITGSRICSVISDSSRSMPVVSTIPCSTPYAAILPLAASVLFSAVSGTILFVDFHDCHILLCIFREIFSPWELPPLPRIPVLFVFRSTLFSVCAKNKYCHSRHKRCQDTSVPDSILPRLTHLPFFHSFPLHIFTDHIYQLTFFSAVTVIPRKPSTGYVISLYTPVFSMVCPPGPHFSQGSFPFQDPSVTVSFPHLHFCSRDIIDNIISYLYLSGNQLVTYCFIIFI